MKIKFRKKNRGFQNLKSSVFLIYFLGFFTGGFNEGVFPGISLLSRCLLSGSPVDLAIIFGPVLSPMVLIFN